MATLADLRTRIISETLRDDLADTMAPDLDLIIQKSIDQYAAVRWWFNEAQASINCTPGQRLLPLPLDFRVLDQAILRIGVVGYRMRERSETEIDARYTAGPINGQPTEFAIYNVNADLWPTPSSNWPVEFQYIADVSPALVYDTIGSASNFWTNQGQDLIVARAKLRLYRDYLSATLSDPRVAGASNQEAEAYTRLRSEHNRRLSNNTVRAGW
jgi:hypothetical protein